MANLYFIIPARADNTADAIAELKGLLKAVGSYADGELHECGSLKKICSVWASGAVTFPRGDQK